MSQLAKIDAVHPEKVLPFGDDGQEAIQIGMVTVGGKRVPLYERTIIRAAKDKVPEIDPTTGEQKWVRHPHSHEPLYRRWRNVREERKQQFTLESDGHANLYIQEYVPPTPEELARQELEAKTEAFKQDFAVKAAEMGLSAGDVLQMMMRMAGGEPAAAGEPEVVVGAEFPKLTSPGRWVLSNGKKVQGSREAAEAAEAALHVTDPDEIPS